MPIVSSTFTPDGHQQSDGRRYVRETLTDDLGATITSEYLAPAGWTDTEYAARLATTVAQVNASLAESEAAALLEQD